MTERELLKRKKELSAELVQVEGALKAKRKAKTIKCGWCGKRTKVSKLTLIQKHWYVRPYGCTGGDYWREGEKQFECPKCGKRNREDQDNAWSKEKRNRQFNGEITKLAPYFGAKVDEHDD